MSDTVILTLVTARSADDCKHCNRPENEHGLSTYHICSHYDAIGWTNKSVLGLSIGGAYSYADDRIHWFDSGLLEDVVQAWVREASLLVSFGGQALDLPLMEGLLRLQAQAESLHRTADRLLSLSDRFRALIARSYDLLVEIHKANGGRIACALDVIGHANGFGLSPKREESAIQDWRLGNRAKVLGACTAHLYILKGLFDNVMKGEPLKNYEGPDLVLESPPDAREAGDS